MNKLPWNAEKISKEALEKRLRTKLSKGYRGSDGRLQTSCHEGVYFPEEEILHHWVIGCSDEVAGR